MVDNRYIDLKMGEKGAIVSIAAYIFLSVLKLAIGFFSNSEALKADGLNNTTDIIASFAVLIGLRLSQKPPDKDHPYGHRKAETVAAMIASVIMAAVGMQVLFDAVSSFFNRNTESPDIISAWTGFFSAGVIYLVYLYNKNLGKKINSQAVTAAAKDNLSDALVSIGTAIGIIGSQFNLPWLDPVTALIVGLIICNTAWGIFRESSHNLTKGVKGVKELRARSYGNHYVVDVVIIVNSTLDIRSAHDISTSVENILMMEYGVYDVHVHVEPI
ncbi:cation diffusion facilitator family transporter [Neobacillus mesonae]|uniref:cation diffusion facilitator family transporter n=1 Tax=Neobacillus mesonae TaxID=1193713 RepID=UPI00203F6BA2|nr:cation diffusion facilitator family transporter [Neobacillus mesonae]MCM3567946.1 cation diffusion facilitator family transporter [Neobacillus mesonae]